MPGTGTAMQDNKSAAVAAAMTSLVVAVTCAFTIRKLVNGEFHDFALLLVTISSVMFILFSYYFEKNTSYIHV